MTLFCLIVKTDLHSVWATFSKSHEWWLGQVSRLFLLACPLSSRDIFLAAGPRRGEKILQEFGPSAAVLLRAWLFCTQQILSLWIKAVCVEVSAGSDHGASEQQGGVPTVLSTFYISASSQTNTLDMQSLQRIYVAIKKSKNHIELSFRIKTWFGFFLMFSHIVFRRSGVIRSSTKNHYRTGWAFIW